MTFQHLRWFCGNTDFAPLRSMQYVCCLCASSMPALPYTFACSSQRRGIRDAPVSPMIIYLNRYLSSHRKQRYTVKSITLDGAHAHAHAALLRGNSRVAHRALAAAPQVGAAAADSSRSKHHPKLLKIAFASLTSLPGAERRRARRWHCRQW
jgi:hypothetical protein